MSLVSYAVRTCLWRALYGTTYAGNAVFDSAVAPIEEMLGGKPTPIITVSTDDESIEVSGHDYAGGDRLLSVIIEVAIASALKDGAGYTIEHTDEGLEQSVNFICRQVMRVLQVDVGIWSDLYRSFACNATKIVSRRGADVEKGIRFAARQIVITVEPLHEPLFGEDPKDEWARLIEAMKGDTDILGSFADGLAAEIKGTAIPDWARLQARGGLRRGAMLPIGLGPLNPGEEPKLFARGTSGELHLSFVEAI